MALWYAASVLQVFVLFALALRVTVRTALRNEFTTGVRSSSDAIRSFFRLEHAEYRDVNATIVHIANEVMFPDRIVEFQRPDGRVAFRIGPNRNGSARAAANAGSTALRDPVQQVLAPLDSAAAPGWMLRVFASAAPLEHTLTLIDRWLLIGIPLGFLFAGGLGWWLAERTLRPVGVMAAAAARMASERRTGAVGSRETTAQRLPIDNPSDELGKLGTRFNALLDQLDGVLAQQRSFLADAAHELRTPVARMLGTVELAQLDPDDAAAQRDALGRVRDDLDRTSRLIDELLQLARADAAIHTRRHGLSRRCGCRRRACVATDRAAEADSPFRASARGGAGTDRSGLSGAPDRHPPRQRHPVYSGQWIGRGQRHDLGRCPPGADCGYRDRHFDGGRDAGLRTFLSWDECARDVARWQWPRPPDRALDRAGTPGNARTHHERRRWHRRDGEVSFVGNTTRPRVADHYLVKFPLAIRPDFRFRHAICSTAVHALVTSVAAGGDGMAPAVRGRGPDGAFQRDFGSTADVLAG